jgi:hypothetical protein
MLNSCLALLQVIMFDPMYDSYSSMAKRVGAVIRPVRLQLPDFSVPREELEQAFSPRTKLILVNTPHNPSGKVSLWHARQGTLVGTGLSQAWEEWQALQSAYLLAVTLTHCTSCLLSLVTAVAENMNDAKWCCTTMQYAGVYP